MASRPHPRKLLVEGQDDKHSIIHLMKSRVFGWDDNGVHKVQVDMAGGVEKILEPGTLTASLKQAGLEAFGVVLDADESAEGRYLRVRDLRLGLYPSLPETLPEKGLIVEGDEPRFGVWIMPDNSSPGTIEIFLRGLVPAPQAKLWGFARESVRNARGKGAAYRDVHAPKADLYTWLAWQDEPGYSPGIALTRRVLDPESPSADPFVEVPRALPDLIARVCPGCSGMRTDYARHSPAEGWDNSKPSPATSV